MKLQKRAKKTSQEETGHQLFFQGKTNRLEDGTYLVENPSTQDSYEFVTPGYSRFQTSCTCADFVFQHRRHPAHRCVHLWASFFAEKSHREDSFDFLSLGLFVAPMHPRKPQTLWDGISKIYRAITLQGVRKAV